MMWTWQSHEMRLSEVNQVSLGLNQNQKERIVFIILPTVLFCQKQLGFFLSWHRTSEYKVTTTFVLNSSLKALLHCGELIQRLCTRALRHWIRGCTFGGVLYLLYGRWVTVGDSGLCCCVSCYSCDIYQALPMLCLLITGPFISLCSERPGIILQKNGFQGNGAGGPEGHKDPLAGSRGSHEWKYEVQTLSPLC